MGEFAYGVDLGWMSQLESEGYYWTDPMGNRKDIFDIVKEFGADSVRFRIFCDPNKDGYWQKRENERCMLGFCDKESVLECAKRVKAAGMRLMLDIHYSDHFADPQFQDIPKAWENHSVDELVEDVKNHTREVLNIFKEAGLTPEWVQVGNEINPGMLLPVGNAQTNMPVLVRFLNAGYDTVKEIFPETIVITHLACGAIKSMIRDFFDPFFAEGGKTDMIGLSHYPYWYVQMENADMSPLKECVEEYALVYKKPVIIAEIGEDESEPDKTYALIKDAINTMKDIPDGLGAGVFYWEPEVGKDALPDKYPLGAAVVRDNKEIRFTTALNSYRH